MTFELGDVITQIGGAGVVREHTPLNVPVTEETLLGEVTIPTGHVLAIEVTTNVLATAMIGAGTLDGSWADVQYAAPITDIPRLTLVTTPGNEGPAIIIFYAETDTPNQFTVTGLTTTLIPIT